MHRILGLDCKFINWQGVYLYRNELTIFLDSSRFGHGNSHIGLVVGRSSLLHVILYKRALANSSTLDSTRHRLTRAWFGEK